MNVCRREWNPGTNCRMYEVSGLGAWAGYRLGGARWGASQKSKQSWARSSQCGTVCANRKKEWESMRDVFRDMELYNNPTSQHQE